MFNNYNKTYMYHSIGNKKHSPQIRHYDMLNTLCTVGSALRLF